MISAIHRKTGKLWKARDTWKEWSDPHNEEFFCCKLHKYPVTPVVHHERNINGERTWVIDHFRMLEDHYCPGESDEHWNIKINTALKIKNKDVFLKFEGKKIDCDFKERDKVTEIKRGNNRADILFELEQFDSLLGFGIVIEVAVTEKLSSLVKKSISWIGKRYSIAWIFSEPEEIVEIKYPYGLYFDIVKWCGQLEWDWKKYHCNIEQKHYQERQQNGMDAWLHG